MVKICKKCGKLFSCLMNIAKYCHSCRDTIKYYETNPIIVIHCKTCGKEIKTNKTVQLFCDANCRKEFHYARKVETVKCAFCGEEFDRSTSKKKYCSHECYLKAKQVRDDARRNGGEIEVS